MKDSHASSRLLTTRITKTIIHGEETDKTVTKRKRDAPEEEHEPMRCKALRTGPDYKEVLFLNDSASNYSDKTEDWTDMLFVTNGPKGPGQEVG